MTDTFPDLAGLDALYHCLSPDAAQQSLLRIAQAKVTPGAKGWLDRPMPRMEEIGS